MGQLFPWLNTYFRLTALRFHFKTVVLLATGVSFIQNTIISLSVFKVRKCTISVTAKPNERRN